MIAYPSSIKRKAKKLRKLGISLGEISKKLNISKSTTFLWLNTLSIDTKAQNILKEKRRKAGIKGLNTIRNNRINKYKTIAKNAQKVISSLNLDRLELCKTICALLYWGEGGKTDYHVSFVNSDPHMISTFINLFRKSYNLDERKFRLLVHLHEYHNDQDIKSYWSQITHIPVSQFTRSYLKPHTGKIKREGFKGTLRVNYYDSKIAYELKALYNSLAQALGT